MLGKGFAFNAKSLITITWLSGKIFSTACQGPALDF
jgi:hypothetical protein